CPKHVVVRPGTPDRLDLVDSVAAQLRRTRFLEEGAMRRSTLAFALLVALTACQKETTEIPAPHKMTAEAIGHYCGMNLFEHPGPKGQIFAASLIEPVWFSSVLDTIAFTMLPDEPKDIQAIYVSDMGKATSWEKPGADNWVEARKALFVIDSQLKGGM